MKAVILAAGEGRRLEPLTDVRPKPMLPVANKPLLEHVLEAVVDAGVEEVVLVIGYKRERIQDHFGDGDDWGIDIEYVVQEKQLGTGHAILQVESAIEGPFLVLNGDRIIETEIVREGLDAPTTDEMRVVVTRSDQPSEYGVVQLDGERVESITEKPRAHAAASQIINAGIYRFDPSMFDAIRATEVDGELAVTDTLQGLVERDRVLAVHYDGPWLDVSYLWDYLEVNAAVLDRYESTRSPPASPGEGGVVSEAVAVGPGTTVLPNATVLRGTALGANVRVGPNAVLSNCIVLPDATVGAGAVLQDCIVGENAVIGPNSTVEGGPATVQAEGQVFEGVRLGGVIGDNASLGGDVTVSPGATVGTGATAEAGSWLRGRLPSGADVRRG